MPTKHDTDGISVDRACSEEHPEFRTAEEAAQGQSPDGYYAAVFRAGDLRARNLRVEPDPQLPDDPGHALLPDLTYEGRKSERSIEWREVLTQQLLIRVEGPFPSAQV